MEAIMKAHSRRSGIVTTAVVVASLLLAACAGSKPGGSGGGAELSIAGYKDATGKIHKVIDVWNNAHPNAKARYIELPSASDQQHQMLAQNFLAHSSTYDVIVADDTWTDEFASKGWLTALPAGQFQLDNMFESVARGGEYQGKLYTVPFTASAEFLYYRKDLVPNPPTTWAQMIADCAMAREKQIGCYAGQFSQYEGLTVNFVSAVASAGGSVLSPDGTKVKVDSPQAAEGLSFLANGFRDGYIPKEAITYQEQQGQQAFQQGKLLFMTNYSFVYNLANTPGPETAIAGKVGIAPIPGLSGPGVVTTGGHMMGVSAYSKRTADATAFVKFFTSEANARDLLLNLGYAPAWKSLYSDPALTAKMPFLPVISEELKTAVVRPRTTNYVALSLTIQKNAYAALQGQKSVADALRDMNAQLQSTVAAR
jgi:multiple sugar transport system substrate-binding protein